MNKKKIFQVVLFFGGLTLFMTSFKDSPMVSLIFAVGCFWWAIGSMEKTYNANFDYLETRNRELSDKITELEIAVEDLKSDVHFIKNDIDVIQHDISPLTSFNDS